MQPLFQRYKIRNLIVFSMLYNVAYIGRFHPNHLLAQMELAVVLPSFQERILTGSVFLSYAGGCFINGILADRFRPRRMILMGAAVSIGANIAILQVSDWHTLLLLWILNGYFQSMIWLSGMTLLAHWWSSRQRSICCGVANFFSGLAHVTSYVLPAGLALLFPMVSRQQKACLPMIPVAFFLLLFFFFSSDRPESRGLAPYEETAPAARSAESRINRLEKIGTGVVFSYFFRKRKLFFWCLLALLSSLCRYGLLHWIPVFYQNTPNPDFMVPSFENLVLPLGMAFGTLIFTIIVGIRFNENKGIMVMIAAAFCGVLVTVFPSHQESAVILTGIFFTGFFLYGINGVLWIYAIDTGGRRRTGTVTGILNGFAYIGASLELIVFPVIARMSHSLFSVFVIMEFFCILMVLCGIAVSSKNTVAAQEPQEQEG